MIEINVKVLRAVSRNSNRKYLVSQFGADRVDSLCPTYFRLDNPVGQNENGFQKDIPDNATYHLTDAGVEELESRKWFTLRYFITNIIVPIAVGVAASVITTLLTSCR